MCSEDNTGQQEIFTFAVTLDLRMRKACAAEDTVPAYSIV
jgi:hypothetical protein